MNKYESVIVINPKLDEQEIDNIIQKVKEIVEQDGTLTQVDKKGIKKLAYEINKCKEGYFIYFYYETDPSLIANIERYFRINGDILKFITLKRDDEGDSINGINE
ncbi:MAG: 30S ribosomal protein S6 [Clostridia bacterium]|nr:30S ribosomal protein S6 [Clostridia bacterium]